MMMRNVEFLMKIRQCLLILGSISKLFDHFYGIYIYFNVFLVRFTGSAVPLGHASRFFCLFFCYILSICDVYVGGGTWSLEPGAWSLEPTALCLRIISNVS